MKLKLSKAKKAGVNYNRPFHVIDGLTARIFEIYFLNLLPANSG